MINPELYRGNIILSRVRLARNLSDHPFYIQNVVKAKEVIKDVNRAIVKCGTFNLYYMANLTPIKKEALKEQHLISQALIDNNDCGAVLINEDQSVSIMVNEEDVIRAQCFMKGLRISEAFDKLSSIDDELSKNLNIAYDEKFGYLTACPTNLGTGLRASVMMFLPALSMCGEIEELKKEVSELGLTVRGIYGEGSEAEGYMYQISNEVTLGASEYDIIKLVNETVEKICKAERDEAERVFGEDEILTLDRVKKAYGVLTNAVMLSYDEFLPLIAEIKIGAMLGMLDISNIEGIDDLIVSVRPASLSFQYGKKLSARDRDLFRAEIVGRTLKKLKGE